MELDDENCLDLMQQSKNIATEIHAHYNVIARMQSCAG